MGEGGAVKCGFRWNNDTALIIWCCFGHRCSGGVTWGCGDEAFSMQSLLSPACISHLETEASLRKLMFLLWPQDWSSFREASPSSWQHHGGWDLTPFTVLNSENWMDRQKQTKAGIILGYSTLTAHLKITMHKGLGFGLVFLPLEVKSFIRLYDLKVFHSSVKPVLSVPLSLLLLFPLPSCFKGCVDQDIGVQEVFLGCPLGWEWAVAAQQALSCSGKG